MKYIKAIRYIIFVYNCDQFLTVSILQQWIIVVILVNRCEQLVICTHPILRKYAFPQVEVSINTLKFQAANRHTSTEMNTDMRILTNTERSITVPASSDGINFIDENDARCFLLGRLKEIPHSLRSNTDIHLLKFCS